jgi:uncharacterized protein YjaZ
MRMERYTRSKDVFVKSNMFATLIKSHIGEISGDDLLTILCHLHHHHRDRRREPLTEKEMIVYDIILKEGLNPHSVYAWFCASKTPEDVRKRIEKGKIDLRQAEKLGRRQIQKERAIKGIEFLRECRALVEVLLE